METRYKVFWSLNDLDELKKNKFEKFKKFNDFLEREGISDYDKVFDSYIKVLSQSNESNYFDYSELDFQIKYLIEEENIAVNSILEFAENKFSRLEKLLKDLFEKVSLFSPIYNINWVLAVLKEDNNSIEKFIEIIKEIKKWELIVKFENPINKENRTYFLWFDLNYDIESFRKFEDLLLDFDVDKIMSENNMIITWIWIIEK